MTRNFNKFYVFLFINSFLEQFDEVLKGSRIATVVLDDPAGNSYVQTLTDEGVADPNLRIFRYHRSHEQNEELGINDMKTEGYENDGTLLSEDLSTTDGQFLTTESFNET